MTRMVEKLHGELAFLNGAMVYAVSKLASARKLRSFRQSTWRFGFFLGGVQSEVIPLQKEIDDDFKARCRCRWVFILLLLLWFKKGRKVCTAGGPTEQIDNAVRL